MLNWLSPLAEGAAGAVVPVGAGARAGAEVAKVAAAGQQGVAVVAGPRAAEVEVGAVGAVEVVAEAEAEAEAEAWLGPRT
jgi:hypothetical protein